MNESTTAVPAAAAVTGTRVGITLHDGAPADLILLPGEFEGTWKRAHAWAAEQGGELPSRIDALVLFQHARAEFKKEWYWIGEQYAGNESYAWCQYFSTGNQISTHKTAELRARAVRRVPLL